MTVTQDATSLKYMPNSAAEWTALLIGTGIANPISCWRFDQLSGACIDLIASNNLTVSGSFAGPAYSQSVTGWSSKGILFHNPNDDNAIGTGGTLPDLATDSAVLFTWMNWPDPGVANARGGMALGGPPSSPNKQLWLCTVHNTLEMHAGTSAGSSVSGPGWAGGGPPAPVIGVLLQSNRDVLNAGANEVQITAHPLGQIASTPPNNVAMNVQGLKVHIGAPEQVGGAGVAGGQVCVYGALWGGTNAELTPTQITLLLNRLNNGPVAPTAVSVAPPTAAIVVGNTTNLTATETFSDASTLDVTSTAAWDTDNHAVATVVAGVVTAVGAGTCSATATKDTFSGSSTITVALAEVPLVPLVDNPGVPREDHVSIAVSLLKAQFRFPKVD